jgi:hypothetical protein
MLILVEKKANLACFHIQMTAPCAWSHVPRVEKNSSATSRQAKKNNANTKSKRPQLQSCENSKTVFPHEESKQISG